MNAIILKDISKKFSGQWIFRNISFEARQGEAVAVTGFNGSGKSTLLQIIAGYISPTNGTLEYTFNKQKINSDNLYQYISLAAPYLELIEEFTLKELITFYMKFKTFSNKLTPGRVIETSNLAVSTDKQIKYYSSGMKQRVKLTLALTTETPYVLLDEPLSNLDQNGIEWFRKMIVQFKENKILFVCSNRVKEETGFCNKFINLENFKKN